MTDPAPTPPRVAIVAEHASARFGGEAILPLHWFRELRKRGVEAWLVVHARTRAELEVVFAADRDRLHFVPDTWVNKFLWRLGRVLPHQLDLVTFNALSHVYTQARARRIARRLIAEHGVNVVHQPIPVSPKEPSLMVGLGVPVVIGPLNGNMDWPAAFAHLESRFARLALAASRVVAGVLNRVFPGKLRADAVLVANERTRAGLPRGVRGQVIVLPENGVDLGLWQATASARASDGPLRVAFLGRLSVVKGLPYLLQALARTKDVHLAILGDGEERARLEQLARTLGVAERVTFTGWLTQAEAAARLAAADALVLPSLRECGGAVMLEAMALGLPVIATAWGGPLDYVDATTGILVPPTDEATFVQGLADALQRLAGDPKLRARLGAAGRARVERDFDWARKTDAMLAIYAGVRTESGVAGR